MAKAPKRGSRKLKYLRFHSKYLTGRMKKRVPPPGFTLCLPGSPKVNAGGACALCGVGVSRIRVPPEKATLSRPANCLRDQCFDELVQWMVQDASSNSRGLKLT